jgi:hypothetical protein
MPILPTVMPDEFVLGYWGRVHILNFLGTPNQTLKALIDYFELPPSRIQRVEALALAANTDVQNFVQNHTLIPAHSAITFEFAGLSHGNPKCDALIKHWWKLTQKTGAYFCPQCAASQQARWGYSYWRRCHQLRGVNWCLEHGNSLLGCPETAFINDTPSINLATGAIPEAEPETTYWPALTRYSEIMHAFLTRTVRTRMRDVAKTLRAVATQKSINTGSNPECQLLSDLALELLPGWWLEDVFPSINSKQPGSPFPALDNTVMARHAQPHAFALAMALIYESSNEALATLTHQAS